MAPAPSRRICCDWRHKSWPPTRAMPLFAPLLLDRRAWSLMLDFLDQRDSLSSTPLVFPPTSPPPPPPPLPPATTTHARLASSRPSTEKRRRRRSAASRLQKVSDTAPRLHGESEVPVEEVARIGIACLLPRVLSPLTSHQANKPPLVHHHSRLLLRYLLACCAPTASTTSSRAAGAARKHTFAPFTTARKAQRCFAHARHRSSLAFL